MKAVARRKLTVLDAMILVAAAAAGIAAARAYYLAARDSSSVSQLKMLIFSKQMLAISIGRRAGIAKQDGIVGNALCLRDAVGPAFRRRDRARR